MGTTALGFLDYSLDDLEQFGVLLDPNGILYEKMRGKQSDNGIYEFEQPFLCRFSTLFNPMPGGSYRIPTYSTPHPFLEWALAVESSWEQLNGDWCRVVTTYKGVLNGGVAVQSSKSTSQVKSIRLSPDWDNILADAINIAGSETTAICYDIDANGNKAFKTFSEAAGDYAGIESYEEGGATHSYSYNSSGPSDRWSQLKKLDSPKGNPPNLPSGGQWLLDDIQQETAGYSYSITETWKVILGSSRALTKIYG